MADYTPVYGRPKAMTFTAGAAITGGQLLVISGADTVSPGAVNPANYAGVAAQDVATGAQVTVLMGGGVVHETTNSSGATIAAGALVYAGASASVTGTPGTGYGAVAIGVAIRTALNGNVLRWKSLIG